MRDKCIKKCINSVGEIYIKKIHKVRCNKENKVEFAAFSIVLTSISSLSSQLTSILEVKGGWFEESF